MINTVPYSGPPSQRALVVAFDIGLRSSGVPYAILVPGNESYLKSLST